MPHLHIRVLHTSLALTGPSALRPYYTRIRVCTVLEYSRTRQASRVRFSVTQSMKYAVKGAKSGVGQVLSKLLVELFKELLLLLMNKSYYST